MQQQQVQVPPKQIVYPIAQVAIQPQPDGGRVLIFTTPTEQVCFPMTVEAAEAIGKALTAPSVMVAPAGNGHGLN